MFEKLKKFVKDKVGQMGGIVPIMSSVLGVGIVLMILGIMLAYQADVVTDISDDFSDDSYAKNITNENLEATNDLSERQDTLVGISVAVIIIALLLVAASIVGIRISG